MYKSDMRGRREVLPSGSEVPRDTRRNNFDLLRLLLAFSVIFLHAYALSLGAGLKTLAKIANLSLTDRSFDRSSLAVKCFFVLSGYLIFKSYDQSSSIASFARKRFLRIYPAYAAVILITAFACYALYPSSAGSYFAGPFPKYVVANLTFFTALYPRIPGVFNTNPGMTLINGALWTIKVEVMFYLAVPLLHFLMKRFSLIPVFIMVYCVSVLYKDILWSTHHAQLSNQLPGQLSFFMSGALAHYRHMDFIRLARRWVLPSALVFIFEHSLGIELFQPLALSVLVLYFAFCLPSLVSLRPRWDLSYGMYIVHFPVLQWFVSRGFFRTNPFRSLLGAILVIMVLASLSWLLIEEPFQRRKAVW